MGRRSEKKKQQILLGVAVAASIAVIGGAAYVAQRTLFRDTPDQLVARADQYIADSRLPEAILEYRRALQLDAQSGETRLKLGDAYARSNDPVNAIKEYIRASDLLPSNADAQLKAASGLLLAGRFEDARVRADTVLAMDPKNAEAQILRGNALAGLKDFDGAVEDYENAVLADPSQHAAFLNLGTLQLLKGNRTEAEAAFQKAIGAAPKSIEARLALANFYWAAGRQADAESALKAGLDIDATNAAANRALGVYYMVTGRVADAEPYFKRLATTINTPAMQATLAQYYVLANRRDDARSVLNELAKNKDGQSIATVRLAALDAMDGQRTQAEERLRDFLIEKPGDLPAQLLYGELLLRAGKMPEAESAAKAALGIDANSARAHALAATTAVRTDRLDDGIKEYEKALSLDKQMYGAAIELSRLHLQQGHRDQSLSFAQQALQIAPRSPEAQSLLVRHYLLQRDLAKATDIVAQLQKDLPNTPGVSNLQALVQLAKNNPNGARAAYSKTLVLDPGNSEALASLTRLDIAGNRTKDAAARLDAAAERATPTSAWLLTVAQGYEAIGNNDRAEAMLKRAIDLDPARLQGYSLLGRLYAKQGRLDEASRQFEAVAARDTGSVPAYTMLGMIQEAQGKAADAEKSYERVLAINGRAPVAANNLAWIYVASNRNLDEALRLAQLAAEQLPDEPNVNDTLGWTLVKKELPARALPHLEAAAKQSPNDASMHYHLGTAYYKTGDWGRARVELSRALELKPDLDGADDARKTLAIVGSGAPAS